MISPADCKQAAQRLVRQHFDGRSAARSGNNHDWDSGNIKRQRASRTLCSLLDKDKRHRQWLVCVRVCLCVHVFDRVYLKLARCLACTVLAYTCSPRQRSFAARQQQMHQEQQQQPQPQQTPADRQVCFSRLLWRTRRSHSPLVMNTHTQFT